MRIREHSLSHYCIALIRACALTPNNGYPTVREQWLSHCSLLCSLIGRLFSAGVNSRSDWLIDLRGVATPTIWSIKGAAHRRSLQSSLSSRRVKSIKRIQNSFSQSSYSCPQTAFLKANSSIVCENCSFKSNV